MSGFKSIESVIFDLADTLVTHSVDAGAREKHVCAEAVKLLSERGCPVEESCYRSLKIEMWTRWRENYSRREIEFTIEEFLNCLLSELGLKGEDIPALASLIIRVMYACELKSIVLKPGAATVLRKLDESGYALGLISNATFSRSHIVNILRKFEIDRYFKVITVSSGEGICKPNPVIFRRTLGKLGVPAGRAVYAGNEFEADVKGAMRAGMKSFYIPDAREREDPECHGRILNDNPDMISLSDIMEILEYL